MFFTKLEKKILKEIDNSYDDISFSFQLAKIIEPVMDMSEEYRELLEKELNNVYEASKLIGKRRYKYAKLEADKKTQAVKKARLDNGESELIQRVTWRKQEGTKIPDNYLFETNPDVSSKLKNNIFIASQSTMDRVDQTIRKDLEDSYNSGEGIDEAKKRIQKRFNGLKTWESQRIARTEIHTTQELGLQEEYNELGVEYRQWITHIDERTRGTHKDINLEIIPHNGVFSNGLKYPGDKDGDIKEWINCRCADIPFIVPAGFMFPPGQAQYHEDDLIPIKGFEKGLYKDTTDELLTGEYKNKPRTLTDKIKKRLGINTTDTEELPSMNPHNQDIIQNELIETLEHSNDESIIDKFNKNFGWDKVKRTFNNLKDLDVDMGYKYRELKEAEYFHTREISKGEKRFIKYVERIFPETKNYKIPIKEVDLDRLTPVQQKRYKLLKEKNGSNWKQYRKQNPNVTDELKELEEIIHDKTIRTERVTIDLNSPKSWKNPTGKQITEGNPVEDYIKYSFSDTDYRIYISTEWDSSINASSIRQFIKKQPKGYRKRINNIVISSQREMKAVFNGKELDFQGFNDLQGNSFLLNKPVGMRDVSDEDYFFALLSHETSHSIDGSEKYWSKKIAKALEKDRKLIKEGKITRTPMENEGQAWTIRANNESHNFISQYGYNAYIQSGKYTEEFAEAVSVYITDNKWLKKNYRNTYNEIKKMFEYYEKKPTNYYPNGNKVKSLFGTRIEFTESYKPKGYDKFKLTSKEEKLLKELTTKKKEGTKLKLPERRLLKNLTERNELNKLHNKALIEGEESLGDKIGLYDNLMKQFKNYVPLENIEVKPIKIESIGLFSNKDAFKLTPDEKKSWKIFKGNPNSRLFTKEQREYKELLNQKLTFNKYHRKLLTDGLDEYESKQYIKYYYEFQKEWNLPKKIDFKIANKFTIPKYGIERPPKYKDIKLSNKFKLSTKESVELDDLQKLKFIQQDKLTPTQEKRLNALLAQDDFNYLYSVRTHNKGLMYEQNKEYIDLYEKLKKYNYKFTVSEDDLFKRLSPNFDNGVIDLVLPKNGKYKKLRGNDEDGLIKELRDNFDDYFTIDLRNDVTPYQREVMEKWLYGGGYKGINEFLRQGEGNVEKYVAYKVNLLKESNSINIDEIIDDAKYYEYLCHELDNILGNNYLKKSISGYRKSKSIDYLHPLINPEGELKVGEEVMFEGLTSVAVTPEGPEHFISESSNPEKFKWMIEWELPEGTKGAYVSHVTIDKYKQEMEYLLNKDTRAKIIAYNPDDFYIKVRPI